MLRANRRALKRGGKIGFWTIHPAAGLSPRLRRIASATGPPQSAMRSTNERLLRSAGFGDIELIDVSAEYATTLRAWLAAWEAREQEMREAVGGADFDRRVANRNGALDAVDRGILKRTLCIAVRP